MKLLQPLLLAGCIAMAVPSISQNMPKPIQRQATKIILTGQVKEAEKNIPVAGASISAGGNVLGITMANGTFSVNVSPGATITITNVGFAPITFKAVPEENGKTFTLQTRAAGELDDVVVTALGIKRQEKPWAMLPRR